MRQWLVGGAIMALGAAVAACGEPRGVTPSGPSASVTTLATLPACDLSGTNPLISHYFGPDEAKVVRDLIGQITLAGVGSATARDRGFAVIAHIAANAEAGTGGDVAAASDLINRVTPCMFTDLAEFPATYPEDYTIAITTASPGGLGVRGGSADPATDPVLSRDDFSGAAPPFGVTWATMLGGNPAPARVAFYGRPGSTAQSYDWKVLPRNATFAPPAIVGVCVDVNTATISMLHEEHVGLLTFAHAYFLDPATCGSLSLRPGFSSWSHRLAQLLLPRPLSASAVVFGGIGGSTGGIGSEFSAEDVPNVDLTFTIQPPSTVTVGETFTVQLRATDPATGAAVGGTQVSILAVNNNGVTKTLLGTTTQTTSNAGVATFGDLSFAPGSTGGYRLVVGGSVLGRAAIVVGQVTSNKVNAKPAH